MKRYNLTMCQKRLLIDWEIEQNNKYNITSVQFILSGSLDLKKLVKTIELQSKYQETLRTYFDISQKIPKQIILDFEEIQNSNLCFEFLDLTNDDKNVSTESELLNNAYRLQNKFLTQVVKLDQYPLVKYNLIKFGKNKFLFAILIPHILIDGNSKSFFLEDFAYLYNNKKVNVNPTNTMFDYLNHSEQNFIKTQESCSKYWLSELININSMKTDIPYYFKNKEISVKNQKKKIEIILSPDISNTINEFVQKQRITPFLFFISILGCLIYKYFKHESIIIGYSVNIRPKEYSNLWGFLVNNLPMRFNFDEGICFNDILVQAAKNRGKDRFFQHYSIENIINDLRKNNKFDGEMFNITCDEVSYFSDTLNLKEINTRSVHHIDKYHPINDLSLAYGLLSNKQFKLDLIYDNNCFAENTIKRMGVCIKTLIVNAMNDYKKPITKIEYIPQKEIIKIIKTATANKIDIKYESIVDSFNQIVTCMSNHKAVVFNNNYLTYQDLLFRSNILAKYLISLGVTKKSFIAISYKKSTELIVIIMAVLKSGAAYVPLDSNYPEQRNNFILSDINAEFIISDEESRSKFNYFAGKIIIINNKFFDDLTQVNIDNIMLPAISANDLAYTIYTSGSSGTPKGVMVEHKSIINLLHSFQLEQEITVGDISTLWCSINFDVSVYEIFSALLSGSTLHILNENVRLDKTSFFNYIISESVHSLYIPPHLIKDFHKRVINENDNSFSHLKRVLVGVEPIAENLLVEIKNKIKHLTIINGYGPTEAAVCATLYKVETNKKNIRNTPIGKPICNNSVYILDEYLNPVPMGLSGELCISGVGLARGYLNNPLLNQEKFINNPFGNGKLYRTGDFGRLLNDGNIEFLQRIDSQIKIRGLRIDLNEIKFFLIDYEGIEDSVVLTKEDEHENKYIVVYLVIKQSYKIVEEKLFFDLYHFLSAKLPFYMVPQHYCLIEKIPVTLNGKIDTRQLPFPQKISFKGLFSNTSANSDVGQIILDLWKKQLNNDMISIHDSFFSMGGTSLDIINVFEKIPTEFKTLITITDLFRFTTVKSLTQYIEINRHKNNNIPAISKQTETHDVPIKNDIAIIGMSCNFPGSNNIDDFWYNLCEGKVGISFFSNDELIQKYKGDIDKKKYVPAKGILENIYGFDANFFDITPREAEIIDPQHRLFLMCSYTALEDAGYDPFRFDGAIGVYAGCGVNYYLLSHLWGNKKIQEHVGLYKLIMNNINDSLSTKVSYKLNLKGTSVTVQTACSTSLVAVHLGCRSLLSKENDLVIAGGVSLGQLDEYGYIYQEGMIRSSDGFCRTFDAAADGTVPSQGVGAVILKRLDDAVRDGDHIYAVIKGSAINNDGADKLSFTAPSVIQQSAVIEMAHKNANVNPENISYIEAHGTATLLGDPIEIEALTHAFRKQTNKTGFCKIGSVKTNIGHTDSAAGVAGLIKTALSINKKQIPPSLNFNCPNPKINFKDSPFHVNQKLTKWESNGFPLIAGVSSFGMGGTNVHVVLEENNILRQENNFTRKFNVFLISAKSEHVLDQITENLANFLEQNSTVDLNDIAYTLQVGRGEFVYRRAVIYGDRKLLTNYLKCKNFDTNLEGQYQKSSQKIFFMFPGQGSQYLHMGIDLYKEEPVFKENMKICNDLLNKLFGLDIFSIVYPEKSDEIKATEYLKNTQYTQPILFSIEYCLTKLIMSWGIIPDGLIGHSLGEYVAACVSGVFSLKDALFLVGKRGELIQQLNKGSMLSIKISEKEIQAYLNDDISVAAVNSPNQLVVSGQTFAIEKLHSELLHKNIVSRLLETSHAFHSKMMQPILDKYKVLVEQINLNKPQITFISNITGAWIDPEQAINPEYWASHILSSVRFSDGVHTISQDIDSILLEIGPGNTLSTLVRQHKDLKNITVIETMRHPHQNTDDNLFLMTALSKLWLNGCKINWLAFYNNQKCHRVSLPTYPFENKIFSIPVLSNSYEIITEEKTECKENPIYNWCYQNIWEKVPINNHNIDNLNSQWIIFENNVGLGETIAKSLRDHNQKVIIVYLGESFSKVSDYFYKIDPTNKKDYVNLLEALVSNVTLSYNIIHLWSYFDKDTQNEFELDKKLDLGFFSVLYLTQALAKILKNEICNIGLITNNICKIHSHDILDPIKSTCRGIEKIIPHEFPKYKCICIDIDFNWRYNSRDIDNIIAEFNSGTKELMIGYRENVRWVQKIKNINFANTKFDKNFLVQHGNYLITGGIGGMGLVFSEYLAKSAHANIILISRTHLPEKSLWESWSKDETKSEKLKEKIIKLIEIEQLGGNIEYFCADITDPKQMKKIFKIIEKKYSVLHGVIHTAGVVNEDFIVNKTKEASKETFLPKIDGTLVLYDLIKNKKPDFFVNCSSLSTILGGIGFVDYCAANCFLDTFSESCISEIRVINIRWPGWKDVGMAVNNKRLVHHRVDNKKTNTILSQEALKVFEIIISTNYNNVIVSPRNLVAEIEMQYKYFENKSNIVNPSSSLNEAISLNEIKTILFKVWEKCLGLTSFNESDNFFALGGDSLAIIQIYDNITPLFNNKLTMADLFQYATIKDLANFLFASNNKTDAPNNFIENITKSEKYSLNKNSNNKIAIIGMAGRFPGAKNVDEFWQNLCQGLETIASFSREELLAAGVTENDLENDNYVSAKGIIHDVESFDPDFFGIAHSEAKIMDPQHRIFLTCCYTALEDAGYDAERFNDAIGVYAGCGLNNYYISHILGNSDFENHAGEYKTLINNVSDSLSTSVAYHMNLTGSAVSVQTACSTSLVAIHLACNSLINYENDIVLAGGVSLGQLGKKGYMYYDGMINSKDGHCRSFDSLASGTVMSQGAGVIVLKRLDDALRDKDNIYAVISGSAINNDGSKKMSFTAPSRDRQAQVIENAHKNSDVDPNNITYVEAHGTGTRIGDPIEVSALMKAFNKTTNRTQYCAIGSVKTNIGHTDAASGVIGIIKTALSLKHQLIVPTLHYKKSNPEIDFENSPFYVNTKLQRWVSDSLPRYAAVSSFGIGGTNAHAILEEAPIFDGLINNNSRADFILPISAKTEKSLNMMINNLSNFLERSCQINLANVAYTLQVGRQQFDHRNIIVCSNVTEAVCQLRQVNTLDRTQNDFFSDLPLVLFIFSNENKYIYDKTFNLYNEEPIFKEHIDLCNQIIKEILNLDMVLRMSSSGFTNDLLKYNKIFSFAIQYSLAQLWISWGIMPDFILGVGIGEYVAGCVSCVFSLKDAIILLGIQEDLMIKSMYIKDIILSKPDIPIFSMHSNNWLDVIQATEIKYWIEKRLIKHDQEMPNIFTKLNINIMIEMVPSDLTKLLAARFSDISQNKKITYFEINNHVNTFTKHMFCFLSKLWSAGMSVNWEGFQKYQENFRISLPTYEFDNQKFWISKQIDLHKRGILSQTFSNSINNIEESVFEVFSNSLGLKDFTSDSSFFELGGDSLLAIQITQALSKRFLISVTVSDLLTNDTVNKFSDFIKLKINQLQQSPVIVEDNSLVKLKSGSKTGVAPIYLIHGIGGGVLNFRNLIKYIDRDIYALQKTSLTIKHSSLNNIEQIANHYKQEIQQIQPNGPYFLIGYSFGGIVGYELAQKFYDDKQIVRLIMLDTPSLNPNKYNISNESKLLSFILHTISLHEVSFQFLEKMSYEERMKYFIDKINLKRNDTEKLDKNQIEKILAIFRSNYEAMQNYVPQEYKQDENVIYYKAAIRDAHNQQNSEHGWQLLLGDQILIKEVSGGHASMLDLPHVEESLAKEILRLQDKDWRVIRV